MKKRLLSVIAALCLLAVSLGQSMTGASAGAKAQSTAYVAFGDSIAAGYGLDGYSDTQTGVPAQSYQALVADFLQTDSRNYAVSGHNSDDCLAILDSGAADTDLAGADVITISIGSNDLLLPFIQIVMDYFDVTPEQMAALFPQDGSTPAMPGQAELMKLYLKYSPMIPGLVRELTDNATLHEKAQAFPEKLQFILDKIHEKAPNAEIYVTNIYNPFAFVPQLGDMGDIYIREINHAFSDSAEDYTLVDVYTPFQQKNLTNVSIDPSNLSGMNADPHPSVEGHRAIADEIIRLLKKNHAPKAATLKSAASSKKTRLTLKVKPASDADGYQIRYAAKKDGAYKTLAAASSATYKTNSAKLKSGKTYYFKVRSYKTLKGVTYYGKYSSTKKVKIK